MLTRVKKAIAAPSFEKVRVTTVHSLLITIIVSQMNSQRKNMTSSTITRPLLDRIQAACQTMQMLKAIVKKLMSELSFR